MIVQAAKATLWLAALTLPLWIVTRSAVTIYRRRRGQPISLRRETLLVCLVLYLAVLAAVTVVPLPMSMFRTPQPDDVNLVPILPLLKCFHLQPSGVPESRRFCLQNLLGNIVLFLPFGVLMPLAFARFNAFLRVLLFAAAASSAIELTQYVSRQFGSYRYVDINDVILNVSGACLGYACLAIVRRYALADR